MSIDAGDAQPGKKWLIVFILVAAVISGIGWMRLRADSSLVPLLPENSPARDTILFFRDSSFADKAILWFRLTGKGSTSDLIAAADATEKRFDPHLISGVMRPPSESGALDEIMGLANHAGELLGKNDYPDLENRITPEAIQERLHEWFMQTIKPAGSFMQPSIGSDPLGLSSKLMARGLALSQQTGYRVSMKDGHFINSDGRQLMLVLETSTTATSMASSEALVAHLNALCAAAPPGITITPICPQIHTEQNQQLMQRDIRMAGIISAIGFLLLFLFISRDWRVAAVFLMPIATAILTIGLCALVHPDLSTMMIGLTIAMAGSAVDYGIFVYTAVSMGTNRRADMRRIRRPLLISHLTTLGVFVAFLFSKIPAYRQLGYLTSFSLILSLLAALFVLPKLLKPRGKIAGLGRGMSLQRWGGKMLPVLVVAAIFIAGAIFMATKIKFDSDITKLDGVSASVKQNEQDFQKNWGRGGAEQAILVVTGKTRQQAEQANDAVNDIVAPNLPGGGFVSLSSLWPSAATRKANEARWEQFWTPQRVAKLRSDLTEAGKKYDFAPDAFEPFFKSIAHPTLGDPPREILASVEGLFVARSNGDWQMLSYFDDTPANTTKVQDLLRDRPDTQVVSRGVLVHAFAQSAVSETHILLYISIGFIIVSLLVLTQSLTRSVIIILPVLTGLVAMLVVLVMMSMEISVVTVIASIIVLALTSDYGVFALYACEGKETLLGQGMASVHLSFLTTLVATGVMLFARHPALKIVGISLTSGLCAGYLTALFVIPGIYFLWHRGKTQEVT